MTIKKGDLILYTVSEKDVDVGFVVEVKATAGSTAITVNNSAAHQVIPPERVIQACGADRWPLPSRGPRTLFAQEFNRTADSVPQRRRR